MMTRDEADVYESHSEKWAHQISLMLECLVFFSFLLQQKEIVSKSNGRFSFFVHQVFSSNLAASQIARSEV